MFIFNSGSSKYIVQYYTSKPYGTEYKENITVDSEIISCAIKEVYKKHYMEPDTGAVTMNVISGEIRQLLKAYTDPVTDTGTVNMNVVSGEIRQLLLSYTDPVTGIDTSTVNMNIVSVDLKQVLVTNNVEDTASVSMAVISGAII